MAHNWLHFDRDCCRKLMAYYWSNPLQLKSMSPSNPIAGQDRSFTRETRNITTLVFDLGGVLIELGDMNDMMASSPFSAEEVWSNWISSPSVRRFESGRSSPDEFAQDMIQEFQLACHQEEFLELFNAWPIGMMKGAIEMLKSLSGKFRLACLSNTNLAHYNSFLRHQPLMDCFEHQFLSHSMGCMKPDVDAFNRAIDGLNVNPSEVAYFDDHPKNVAAAAALGMHALEVHGPEDIMTFLQTAELL